MSSAERESWWTRLTRRERRAVVTVAIVAGAVAVIAVLMAVTGVGRWLIGPWEAGSATPTATPLDTVLYIDPAMQSIAAAADDPRFEVSAETPQDKWFTDWSTARTAESDAAAYLDAAEAAGQVPVMVLYRIPQRDYGAWANGGAADVEEYRQWVRGIARALDGHDDAIVIVEPDALPQLGKCEQDDRLETLADAVDVLSQTGARVYVDAGHENWVAVDELAQRLVDVGVEKIAGFSLNVSAFYDRQDETVFAERVLGELEARGVDDAHYVIDTGRNGAERQSDDNCNPPWARLGAPPQLFTGTALDAYLWVKNPGETDGACRGGPAAGFWAPAALDLLGLGRDS